MVTLEVGVSVGMTRIGGRDATVAAATVEVGSGGGGEAAATAGGGGGGGAGAPEGGAGIGGGEADAESGGREGGGGGGEGGGAVTLDDFGGGGSSSLSSEISVKSTTRSLCKKKNRKITSIIGATNGRIMRSACPSAIQPAIHPPIRPCQGICPPGPLTNNLLICTKSSPTQKKPAKISALVALTKEY